MEGWIWTDLRLGRVDPAAAAAARRVSPVAAAVARTAAAAADAVGRVDQAEPNLRAGVGLREDVSTAQP